MKLRLPALAATLLSAMALAVVPAVAAQPQPPKPGPPNQPVVNSWALSPTGSDASQPGTRAFLSYDMAPGATVRDSVTLWNFSNVPLHFKVYATDAFNNRKGEFDLLPGERQPTDAGSWVTLTYTDVDLSPRAKVDIPFTVAVPPTARPGDHAAAVLAANQAQGTGPDGKVVNVDRRTGSRMYVRVKGAVQPALAVENVRTVYHNALSPMGGFDVTYTVRNAGNVRLAAHRQVQVKGPFGLATKARQVADVPELLPGNAVTYHEHFSSVPDLIRATGVIKLVPFSSAGDVQAPAVSRAGHTWAMPWSLIALAVIVLLARRAYQAIKERRRVLGSATPPVREPTPVP